MVDFMQAIKKPFGDMQTLGIGAIIGAIPVVSILISGYAAKTAEDVMNKKNTLRAWQTSDVIEYIVKAIIIFVISIVYYIIPGIIVAAGIGGAVLKAIAHPGALTDPTTVLSALKGSLLAGAPLIGLGILVGLLATFLLPMAIMKWLKAGKISAALNIIAVLKNAFTLRYIGTLIGYLIYAVVLLIVGAIISAIVGLVPVIGWILSAVVMGGIMFALDVTGYTLLAQTVN